MTYSYKTKGTCSTQIDLELDGNVVHNVKFTGGSTNFTITAQTDSFLFTTKGYGHGVGLSQYGADYMARQGSGYEEILLHYYTGAQLAKAVEE